MHESDEVVEHVAMTLRRERVGVSADFDARVMERVREEARQAAGTGVWRWMIRTRETCARTFAGTWKDQSTLRSEGEPAWLIGLLAFTPYFCTGMSH